MLAGLTAMFAAQALYIFGVGNYNRDLARAGFSWYNVGFGASYVLYIMTIFIIFAVLRYQMQIPRFQGPTVLFVSANGWI